MSRDWPEQALGGLAGEEDGTRDLSSDARAALVDDWSYRAAGEFAASIAFGQVVAHLGRLRPEPQVAWLLTRAVSDEIRHAEICRHVASRFAGSELPWPQPPDEQAVVYPGVPASMVHLVLAIHMSCVSETIGAAFLRACLAETTIPLVKRALRTLLTDEVDHSRIGWALLASPRRTPEQREVITAALPMLVESGRRSWRARMQRPASSYPLGYGLLRESRLLDVVDGAIAELIIPGFRHVGLDVAPVLARIGDDQIGTDRQA